MYNLLDANVILRYLLNDIPEQAAIAESAIKEGAFTLPEVLCEVVYVLSGVYNISRADIKAAIIKLLSEINIQYKPVMELALALYAERNIDFVDSILIARAKILGDNVVTFDKKVKFLLNK